MVHARARGDLVDVETLFAGRLDDYDAGAARLRAADVSGQRTYAADHNQRELATILAECRAARENLVTRCEALDEAGFARTAIHPRLDRPMRVCDMMLFASEHDDYHLALITRLLRRVCHLESPEEGSGLEVMKCTHPSNRFSRN